jgi:hypothetical protein
MNEAALIEILIPTKPRSCKQAYLINQQARALLAALMAE